MARGPESPSPSAEVETVAHGEGARAAGPPEPAGLAHVGALSFLASRAAPSGAFVIALAGGVALARAGWRFGGRRAYGASLAAMVQTIAYLGPARLNGPLTQALTAPAMGALERRGVGGLGQFAACLAGRVLHNAVGTTFFIFVLLGGLDAYVGTYDETFGGLGPLPTGTAGALAFTAVTFLGWAVGASVVQVLVYRRGLRRWPAAGPEDGDPPAAGDEFEGRGRFDPRAVAVAAAVAFALLVASTAAPVLLAVSVWLGLAWALSRPDRRAVPAGVAFALLLGGGSLAFSLIGGLGLEIGLRRGARALLLVLVATWLRAAARSGGVREVARRTLGRLRGVPAMPEAAAVLDELGAEARLAPSARALATTVAAARRRPLPMIDAVLGWVAAEAARFRGSPERADGPLRLRTRDVALVIAAAAPAIALLAG